MLVNEVMTTPVVTVPESATVKQAVRILDEHKITAAPVLGADGRMVGIVSELDLLRGEFEADPRAFARQIAAPQDPPPRRVAEVMTTEVVTTHETADVAALAELMTSTRLKSVPVVRDGDLVGTVSRSDLLRTLAHSDARIREDVLAAIDEQFPGTTVWDVVVRDGNVELHGHADALTTQVVDVIAKTVAGVSRVAVLDTPHGEDKP
jgi:CBS domain-containing protein